MLDVDIEGHFIHTHKRIYYQFLFRKNMNYAGFDWIEISTKKQYDRVLGGWRMSTAGIWITKPQTCGKQSPESTGKEDVTGLGQTGGATCDRLMRKLKGRMLLQKKKSKDTIHNVSSWPWSKGKWINRPKTVQIFRMVKGDRWLSKPLGPTETDWERFWKRRGWNKLSLSHKKLISCIKRFQN